MPSPARSATAIPGQIRLLLGPRHLRLPLSPRSATTSYPPQMTSGWPSPSRSTTAGEEDQPVSHQGPERQPPYDHFRTGALRAAPIVVVKVKSPDVAGFPAPSFD